MNKERKEEFKNWRKKQKERNGKQNSRQENI